MGDQPPNLLFDQAQAITRQLHGVILRAFPKPVGWNKFQVCTQNLINLFMILTIDFRLFLKKILAFFSDADSTRVAFNFMLINELNCDLSLLVKRTRMEWETTPIPDLVNLANQLSQTPDESPQKNMAKILQLQQMKGPKQNKTFLVSSTVIKSQDIEKEIITNLSTLGTFSLLISLSNVLLILNDMAPRNYRGSSQSSSLAWRNICLD